MILARTIGIWVTGLLAAMIIGGGIGAVMGRYGLVDHGEMPGWISGLLAFACVRLWWVEARDHRP